MNRKQASVYLTRAGKEIEQIHQQSAASENGRANLELLLRNEQEMTLRRSVEARVFDLCTDPKLSVRWIADEILQKTRGSIGSRLVSLSYHPVFIAEIVDPESEPRGRVFMESVDHVLTRIAEAAYKFTFDRTGNLDVENENTAGHWRLLRAFLVAFDERWEKSPKGWGLGGTAAMWSEDDNLTTAYNKISRMKGMVTGGMRQRAVDSLVSRRAQEMDGCGLESVARLVGATRAVWAEIDRMMVPPEVLAGFPAGLLRRVEGPRPWNLDEMYAEPGIDSKVPMPLSSLMIRSRLDRPYEPIFPEQAP
jgi:hypothetical protein